jgi:hypothetical protein
VSVKKILSKSIYKDDFCFLFGKQIHETIRVAQVGQHSIKTKKLSAVVVKLGLSKDYDWKVGCM